MEQIILNHRYQLGRRVGVGGMAYVYEAEDTLLKRKVAVKILKQEFVDDAEFLKKFENEAQSAASLNHANIVNVYDVGREEVDDKVLHFIVMELVEGTTLKELIRVQGKMSNEAIARISTQIAKALECAHEHNIIHRDVKPANILIMRSGDVKVADFGIARISSNATITYTNSILGTVHYISPEQAKGKFIDQKSDIYSLGVVMYEMATGQVPFDAENSVGIAIKHIQELPCPPIERNPGLDPGLNAIIMRCLEKEPTARFQDAHELIEALNDYKNLDDTHYMTAPIQNTARMHRAKPAKEAVYRSKRPVELEEEEEEPSSGRGKWVALFVILAVLIAGGMIFAIHLQNQKAIEEQRVTMPDVINMNAEEAVNLLKKQGITATIDERIPSDTVPEGAVIDQSIPEGARLDPGARVSLVVSTGVEEIKVPDLSKLMPDQATAQLHQLGLKIAARTEMEFSDTVDKGLITRTEPAYGTSVSKGAEIKLYISNGREQTTTRVPSLIGMQQSDAQAELERAQLKPGNVSIESSDEYEAGRVIRQSIAAGVEVSKSTMVDLVISSGPKKESSERPQSSSETPPASSEETPQEPRKQQINLSLTIPEGKESFLIEVFDKHVSATEPIYKKQHSAADAGADGKIHIQVEGTSASQLEVRYDGVTANLTINP
uniref:Stk1 family PASTA domain-containing Ser/Thr kinase n=1 Tax=Ndongobacter massiliensis TaxID=1871025 RepID=UPI000931ECA6|nr:Stk1 family PASTA domain-containing Ser/Thr kinase [Ndongobacter massiliensis]